ncbi:MAG: DUF6691 family protein [Pseudomonadales bacterium]
MQYVVTFVSGLTFGVGLILSGMTDPAKVLAFLDLAGAWDPSLAFVMGGAVVTALVPFTLAKRRSTSLLGLPMQLPKRRDIDRPLVVGSLMFGAGWGVAGFCPGPALVSLATGQSEAVVFCLAMLAGMALHDRVLRRHA